MMDTLLSPEFLITLAKLGIPLILFQILPILVLMERRGAAFIQDRPGPNRASINLTPSAFFPMGSGGRRWFDLGRAFGMQPEGLRLRGFGMLFNGTDAVKLLFKEHFIPPFVHKGLYSVAPMIPMICALLTPAMIPWFAPILYADGGGVVRVSGQIIESSSGLLLLFAMGALSVYGVVLGSWASNSKYSLLGGMRASAMMISYEVSMGLSVLGMLLLVGSLSLTDVVEWQSAYTWGIVVQPVGFVLFLISMFAEANRNPFDVAEGESEIVAGFHTEFNGVRFMMYMSAEYLHVLLASVLLATIYLGGYDLLPLPGYGTEFILANLGGVAATLLAITGLLVLGFVWLINLRRHVTAAHKGSDKASRVAEYGFYMAAFTGLALTLFAGAVACAMFLHADSVNRIYPLWASIVTAIIQFHVILAKTMLFVWLFVWVRWTLPRFRYDQIMNLGWKVMLNIALVNLLVTAIVAKLIRG